MTKRLRLENPQDFSFQIQELFPWQTSAEQAFQIAVQLDKTFGQRNVYFASVLWTLFQFRYTEKPKHHTLLKCTQLQIWRAVWHVCTRKKVPPHIIRTRLIPMTLQKDPSCFMIFAVRE